MDLLRFSCLLRQATSIGPLSPSIVHPHSIAVISSITALASAAGFCYKQSLSAYFVGKSGIFSISQVMLF